MEVVCENVYITHFKDRITAAESLYGQYDWDMSDMELGEQEPAVWE